MYKKAFLLFFTITSILAVQSSFVYDVDLNHQDDNVFYVRVELPNLTQADSIYSFVAYAPGAHQALNFGRFVKSFNAYDADGNILIATKKGVNEWKLLEPQKTSAIEYVIDDSFDTEAEGGVILPMSGTSFEQNYASINTFGVIGYFENHKSDPVELNLVYDYDWVCGSALDSEDGHKFKAESFYHLYDSPILLGDLTKATRKIGEINVEVYLYTTAEGIDANQIMDMAGPVLNSAYNFVEFAAVNRYVFLMELLSIDELEAFLGGGALEHSYSSLYALPAIPQFLPELPRIMGHEFMHILTPLHLRSEIIANFDYSTPTTKDKHLWLYEGVTEWVAQIMRLRSGLVSLEDFGNMLTQKLEISEQIGSDWSLLKLSTDWSRPDAGNRYVDIYQLGALTATCLDIEILHLTNGKRGLREVYLEMIKKYGKDKPFDNDTFIDDFVNATHPKVRDFFDKYILDKQPLDFQKYFGAVGFNYYPEKVSDDTTALFGIFLGQADGRLTVNGLTPSHKPFGLQNGDIIEEVFGIDAASDNLEAIQAEKAKRKPGDKYEITVRRADEKISLTGELVVQVNSNVFEPSDELTDEQRRLRDVWMVNLPLNN